MKRLFLLIMAFLLASCSINRKVTKSEKIQAESVSKLETHSNVFDYRSILDSLSMSINATIKIYDTSKPADSLGQHPVLADIVLEGKATDVRNEGHERKEDILTQVEKKEKKNNTSKEETTKKTKSSKSFFITVIGLIIIIFGLSYWIRFDSFGIKR